MKDDLSPSMLRMMGLLARGVTQPAVRNATQSLRALLDRGYAMQGWQSSNWFLTEAGKTKWAEILLRKHREKIRAGTQLGDPSLAPLEAEIHRMLGLFDAVTAEEHERRMSRLGEAARDEIRQQLIERKKNQESEQP